MKRKRMQSKIEKSTKAHDTSRCSLALILKNLRLLQERSESKLFQKKETRSIRSPQFSVRSLIRHVKSSEKKSKKRQRNKRSKQVNWKIRKLHSKGSWRLAQESLKYPIPATFFLAICMCWICSSLVCRFVDSDHCCFFATLLLQLCACSYALVASVFFFHFWCLGGFRAEFTNKGQPQNRPKIRPQKSQGFLVSLFCCFFSSLFFIELIILFFSRVSLLFFVLFRFLSLTCFQLVQIGAFFFFSLFLF